MEKRQTRVENQEVLSVTSRAPRSGHLSCCQISRFSREGREVCPLVDRKSISKYNFKIFFSCMGVYGHICVCTICMLGDHRGYKRALDLLELVTSHCVVAEK